MDDGLSVSVKKPRGRHRASMVVLIVIGCLIVAGAAALGIYRHDNLHYMDHVLDATWAAGFTEKQAVLSDG